MARKARAEVEGGLYHVMTRGNNRRRIFNCPSDYRKFLAILGVQKTKLPFFLYAYCLMTNHVHLLIERRADSIGRIMQRVLTGYSQYYNKRYRRSGHLLQGRYKASLCQSDRYLAELVRYIHLNPVRAGMVDRPEQYQDSGHRAYLGTEPAGIVDVEPVLRHFGTKKKEAREAYRQFVNAGIGFGYQAKFEIKHDAQILGSEEFVDATIRRIGRAQSAVPSDCQYTRSRAGQLEAVRLIAAVEKACRISRADFYGSSKNARLVRAKEILIVSGRELGASIKELAEIIGLSTGSVSKRYDTAKTKMCDNGEIRGLVSRVKREYLKTDG